MGFKGQRDDSLVVGAGAMVVVVTSVLSVFDCRFEDVVSTRPLDPLEVLVCSGVEGLLTAVQGKWNAGKNDI